MAEKQLSVTLVSSEVVPYAKTGGLADVAGALPAALSNRGVNVRIVMPRYQCVGIDRFGLKEEQKLEVPLSNRMVPCTIYTADHSPGVKVYFIDHPGYYDRKELYSTKDGDYADNAERYIFFMRAVLEMLISLDLQSDIIHLNDWQTALIPVYLKLLYKNHPFFDKTASVYTIHNMAYQGVFWHYDLHLTGLDWDIFTYDKLEFYGKLNLMKGGIVYSDVINTVSSRYAEEIQTEEYGCGLDKLLKFYRHKLFGILNGVDYSIWNPASDTYLTAKYDSDNMTGKKECREFIQSHCGLPVRDVPVLSLISRLTEQKGLDLLESIFDKLMERDIQFILLGTGDKKYHDFFRKASARYQDKISVNLKFDSVLAHQVEAGSDIFLMPSRFEPCGLNQIMSLKYGTVPVVRKTGGLADTIFEYNESDGTGNGFCFEEKDAEVFLGAIVRALDYYHKPGEWNNIIKNGMVQDFSWDVSSQKYIRLYNQALSMKENES